MDIDKNKRLSSADQQRRRAEELLKAKAMGAELTLTNDETQRLLHELQIHQIELEMQNAELRQTRDNLETALNNYTDLYDFAPVGYFTLNSNGTILAVNLTGASLLRVERPRLIGKRFGLFIQEGVSADFPAFLVKVFESHAKEVCEVTLCDKKNRHILGLFKVVGCMSGKECRIAVIDITEHRRAEEALTEKQQELAELNNNLEERVRQAVDELSHKNKIMIIQDRRVVHAEEEKLVLEQQFQHAQKMESLGVLAGGIAHDFNNILTIILGHCYMVKEYHDFGMTDKDHVRLIEAASIRAADLCRQMLAYASQNPQIYTRVNLWLLIDEVVQMLTSALKKNVTIKLDLKRDVPDLNGDSAQIQQILMNLIINAAEAIGDMNGIIKVALKKTTFQAAQSAIDFMGTTIPAREYACLEVSDNGCGMDDETKKRLFEPFFTTKLTGRGLGMSAVLGIIKSFDGALQFTSSPGVGTTFKIFFPLSGASASVEPASRAGLFPMAKGNGAILLVDDEEGLRLIGSALLNAMGFSTITASNGREALDIFRLRGSEINLLLLDLIMPEMGGLETYHSLREVAPVVPIVFCSGYNVEEVSGIVEMDAYAGVVKKPYNPDQLREVLSKLMEREK
jgi:signal transduction histidine kinase/CheY-like chemotaxis protein